MELRKRIVSLLLMVSMLMASMPSMSVMAQGTPTPDTDWFFSNPSASDFTITTADQLAGLAAIVNNGTDDFVGRTITLGSDINLTAYGTGFDGGQGWMPIGVGNGFRGTFDGNGHRILNLYINRTQTSGLFATIQSATIRNLSLEGVSVNSLDQTGSIAGWSVGSIIANSHASGSIAGSTNTGGLVGMTTSGGTISGSSFSGTVQGTLHVGGLVGNARENLNIINCSTTGSIVGTAESVGGIVGRSGIPTHVGVTISNSLSTASVSGVNRVGGLVGMSEAYRDGHITNSAALNPVVQGGDPSSRIIGLNSPNHQLRGNIALNSMSSGSGDVFDGAATHDGLQGESVALDQLLSQAFWTTGAENWTAWDTNVWHIVDGALPTLRIGQTSNTSPGGLTLTASTATGRPGDEVDITVSLRGNQGIAGFSLSLGFDSAILIPLSVTRNNALGGSVFISNVNEVADPSLLGGVITAVWAASFDIATEELFTIRFRINDIYVGENQTIVTPINVYIDDMRYLSRVNVLADRQDGSVTISRRDGGGPGDGYLWGDVNVNDVVDIHDLIRFAQHLASVPSHELTGMGLFLADVDRNNMVDLGDLILIARYLASEDMDNPDVILGVPQ